MKAVDLQLTVVDFNQEHYDHNLLQALNAPKLLKALKVSHALNVPKAFKVLALIK